MKKTNCSFCGKEIISKYGKQYCNVACRRKFFHELNKKVYIKKCVICDKEFETTFPNVKYCSSPCSSKAKKIKGKIRYNNLNISVEEYLGKEKVETFNEIEEKEEEGVIDKYYFNELKGLIKAKFKSIDSKDITDDSYFFIQCADNNMRKRNQSNLGDYVINYYTKIGAIKFYEKVEDL